MHSLQGSDLKDPIHQAALENAAAFAKAGGLLIFFLSQFPLRRPDSNTASSCLFEGIHSCLLFLSLFLLYAKGGARERRH